VARLLILNTPQNPTGKVFHEDELLEMVKVLHDFPRVRALLFPPLP
jgi:aspartate/methionine/tyrosine aminotransferase